MVLVKNLNFFLLFVFGTIGREKVTGKVLDWKLAFLVYKNIDLRKSKICIFPKGLGHGFGQKFEISSFFRFYITKGQVKVFCHVFDWKVAFLVQKI